LLFLILTAYFILRASLPNLDGSRDISVLNQSVTINRDAQGIPTIKANNRQDTAFALGYVHAQERFFQMDLLRRSASGELAEIFGDDALDSDIKVKVHRFKERARKIIRWLPAAHYTALMSYSNGVNYGLEGLTNDPYQYLLLGHIPRQWEVEDSLLCIFAMYFDLNDELGDTEMSLAVLKDSVPPDWFNFLTPKGGTWDAAMDGGKLSNTSLKFPAAKLPESFMAGLVPLNNDTAKDSSTKNESSKIDLSQGRILKELGLEKVSKYLPGSNSWAIDASLTPTSSAMMANDMHLTLRVPNIWYRASWFLDDGRRVSGVTLPGVPAMVAGSNENIAWGFTNSYGDWEDLIVLKTNKKGTQYQTAEGWKNFDIHSHTTYSSSGLSKEHLTLETEFGPVVGKNHKGELVAHQWVAYAPQAVNMNVLGLESSDSLEDALHLAPKLGMPPQNIVVADSGGHIGWTISGPIPERDPNNTKQGKWLGYKSIIDYPKIVDPETHRLWTANNRLVSNKNLSKIGFKEGDMGARAQQIQKALLADEQFDEAGLMAIQLDNRSVLLQRWQKLLLDKLEAEDAKVTDSPKSATLLLMIDTLKSETDLSASADSVAYGLVRTFRQMVVQQSVGWIFDALEQKTQGLFKGASIDEMIEYPVWELISKQPEHLVPFGYDSWHSFIMDTAQKTYDKITENGQKNLAQQTWGKLHKVEIRHPLSSVLPGLNLLLDMPTSPLDGDDHMPKVLGSDFGASMRMVVSPGQEKDGIMHMPGGQSSHPLSSYYSKGHQDWVLGKPSSFLPGKTKWTLVLKSQ